MRLADDLLDLARRLAQIDPTLPKQASLRRAISTTYYALFHLLVEEASKRLTPLPELRPLLGRAFNHGDMKKAAQAFSRERPPPLLEAAVGTPIPPDLRLVAEAFARLQEERHTADYNTAASYTRTGTRLLIGRAAEAFAAWQRVRAEPTAAVFLTALLVGDRWSR